MDMRGSSFKRKATEEFGDENVQIVAPSAPEKIEATTAKKNFGRRM